MRKHASMFMLALLGAGCLTAIDAGAVDMSELTGTRLPTGLVLSFVPDDPANAESPQLRFYIDVDANAEEPTGFKIGKIGADFKYEGGKLYCYVGDEDGKPQWEPLDVDIVKATRKGRHTFFLSNEDMEISGVSPIKVVACVADGGQEREAGELNVAWRKLGEKRLPQSSGERLSFKDPAGDTSPAARVDFISCFVQRHKSKPNTLMFGFTSDFPINVRTLSYHLRLMLRIGDAPGASVNGESFNYMIENRNLFRYIGETPHSWKWEKVGPAPMRFTKQWCEVDLPLDLLPEKPDKVMFRFSCENDFVPDQSYELPSITVK